MIDGVVPSKIFQIENLRYSHYRNMNQIINKNSSNISFLSNNMLTLSQHRKFNHRNWRNYNSMTTEQTRFRNNMNLFSKLQKISNRRALHLSKTENSPPRDPLLHHNNLYEIHRRSESIQQSNMRIGYRITKIKGDIDCKKQQEQFRVNQQHVVRLEKFDRFKRLSRLVTRSVQKPASFSSLRLPVSSFVKQNPEL